MLLAVRPGTDGILIPHEYRERYRGWGCTFVDAPAGYVEVGQPTPLAEARRVTAQPTPLAGPTIEPAGTPPRRRRGRGPGE